MAELAPDAGPAAEAVARRSYGRLVALLASRSGDVAGAEDALAEAFGSALATWPGTGVPANPEGWLLVAARRRIVDGARRTQTGAAAVRHLQLLAEERDADDGAAHEAVPDRRLALMFVCAHPAVAPEIRAPLMLQTVLGLEAAEIASAFLVSPAAMAARLGRAKQKIREAAIPFRLPDAEDLAERLDAVLSAIYAAYAEGWTDAEGSESRRRNLAGEAIWLGRLMAWLMPDEPEASGLVALMLHAEARRPARRSPSGAYVPLGEQDPSLWDLGLIREADAALRRANRVGPTGRFQIEAAIQSVHAARWATGRTDWPAILSLYGALLALTGSPVVALNRAVALAEVEGPAAAIQALDDIAADPKLAAYQPYWAARARLLAGLGAREAAREAYGRAIGLEPDGAARAFLIGRRSSLDGPDCDQPSRIDSSTSSPNGTDR